MVGSNIDKTGITPEVVNTVRIGTWYLRVGKVVALNLLRLLCRKPLLASIVVVANEFFLLCVHGNHRNTLLQTLLYRCIDMPELLVTIRMVCSLFRLPVALQAIVQIVKYLRHTFV